MQNDERKKGEALRGNGTFNPRAARITDVLFVKEDFFDARDLVQVKYEMLRRVREEGMNVVEAAASFGFSRVAFYAIQRAWECDGMSGLLPRRRGPQHAHKLTDAVMEYVFAAQSEDATLRAPALVALVRERFGIKVHPRSIERALTRRSKKGL